MASAPSSNEGCGAGGSEGLSSTTCRSLGAHPSQPHRAQQHWLWSPLDAQLRAWVFPSSRLVLSPLVERCFVEWVLYELFKHSCLGDLYFLSFLLRKPKPRSMSPGAGLSLVARDTSFHLVTVHPGGLDPQDILLLGNSQDSLLQTCQCKS